MKVLFLDIDGVLNSIQSIHFFDRVRKYSGGKYDAWYLYYDFCPIAVSNLLYILENVPDLKIVLSSTWRMGCRTVEDLQNIFRPIGPIGEPIRKAMMDRTDYIWGPDGKHVVRGVEIKQWLTEHPEVTSYVIVDDDADMADLMPALVQTSGEEGLNWTSTQEIIKRFS